MKELWLLYHPAMKRARSGHVGLIVLDRTEEEVKEDSYFSLYHAWLPSEVRRIPWLDRFSSSIPSTTVTTYQEDIIMRGQSWRRTIDENGVEDETVQDLIAGLKRLDENKKQDYFSRGQYDYAYRLPEDQFDIDKLIKHFKNTAEIARWAFIGRITRGIFFDPTAYNCCSAIESALEKGHRSSIQNEKLQELSYVGKKALRLGYFFAILFSSDVSFTFQNPLMTLFFLPALYFILQNLKNTYDFITMNDFKMTAIGSLNAQKVFMLTTILGAINLIFMPFTSDIVSDTLSYPINTVRRIEKKYGAIRYNAKDANLPRFQFSGLALPTSENEKKSLVQLNFAS